MNKNRIEVYFNEIESSEITEFLNKTLIEFAKVSTKLFNNIGDCIFAYKEKQLSSIFLPAFFNLGYGAMQEAPTRRKPKGEESSHGWLDYWVQKNDDCIFLIELKHNWQFLNNAMTKHAKDKLNDAVKQLKNIRVAEVKKLSLAKNTYKIALLVLPVYRNLNSDIKEGDKYLTKTAELKTTADKIIENIGDEVKIDWLGIWSLPKEMQYAFQPKREKTLESFCGVILIATICK